MKKSHVLILAFALILVSSGCTHKMEITNLDNYRITPTPPARSPHTVGVTSNNVTDPRSERYISAIVEAMQKNGNIGRVIYPYNKAMHQDLVDSTVDIAVNPRYSGKGSNFVVNWPGFLIFAPAIWGYGYSAELNTDMSISDVLGSAVNRQTVAPLYEFRHAAMGRTWTEVGWFEVGIIPLVGGIVFTDYDPDATEEFITIVSPNYGAYIAQKIIAALPEKKAGVAASLQNSGSGPAANEKIATAPTKTF